MPESAARILEQRARELARVPTPAEEGERFGLLCFSLGEEAWALDVRLVASVQRRSRLSRLPGLPDYFAGIFVHEGRILPALDLRPLIGRPTEPPASRVVVLGGERPTLALVAESIDEVSFVLTRSIHAALPTGRFRGLPIAGIAPPSRAIIDLPRLLEDERFWLSDGPTGSPGAGHAP